MVLFIKPNQQHKSNAHICPSRIAFPRQPILSASKVFFDKQSKNDILRGTTWIVSTNSEYRLSFALQKKVKWDKGFLSWLC